MKVIWKYDIPASAAFELEMPEGSRILSVQSQQDAKGVTAPRLWAMVEDSALKVKRRFHLAATGRDCEGFENFFYLGTFQVHGGLGVFHLFESISHG